MLVEWLCIEDPTSFCDSDFASFDTRGTIPALALRIPVRIEDILFSSSSTTVKMPFVSIPRACDALTGSYWLHEPE